MKDGLALRMDPLRLWNAALSALSEGIPLAGRGRAVLRACPPDEAMSRPVFRLDTGEGVIHAELRHLPLGPITQSTLDGDSLSRLPPALASAILSHAIGLVLRQLGQPVQARIRAIAPCEATQPPGDESLLLSLEGLWPETAELRLVSDRATLAPLLLDLMPAAAPGKWPEALAAGVHLPCSLRLAPRDLPLSRLRALGPGDILILAGAQQALHAPHATFHLIHDGSNWTIGSLDMTDDLPPAEPAPELAPMEAGPEPAAPSAPTIGDIPVRLSFVLSEHSLTVAELQNLAPGAYLPLDPAPVAPGRPVRILANGRPVGEGHLVEIDAQPAVRIARLLGA